MAILKMIYAFIFVPIRYMIHVCSDIIKEDKRKKKRCDKGKEKERQKMRSKEIFNGAI